MSTVSAAATLQKRGSLKADLVYNIGSQFFLRIATAATALYAARVLGPEQFGIWAVLQVMFMYTAQGHLGTANAMMREAPVAIARGEQELAQQVVNSTWAFVTISSVVVSGCAAGIVLWFYPHANRLVWVACGSAWLAFVQLQSVFFQFYCRAYSTFKLMAVFSVSQALLTVALAWWLVPLFGISGYLFAVAGGFSLIPCAVVTRPGMSLRFHLGDWRRLLSVGLPMLPGTLMLYLNMSMERLVLASTLSAVAVGIFAAAAFVFQVGATLWELVIYTWYARLASLYGRTERVGSVASVLRNIMPGAIWISSAAQGLIYIVLPPLLNRLLPNYAGCAPVAQLLILAMNLWGIGQFLSFALTVIGRQKRSLALQAGFLILKLAMLVVAVAVWPSVYAVAVASGIALVVYAGAAWIEWSRTSSGELPLSGTFVLLWFAPLALAVVCGAICGTGTVAGTAVLIALYLVVIGSLSLMIESRAEILSRVVRGEVTCEA